MLRSLAVPSTLPPAPGMRPPLVPPPALDRFALEVVDAVAAEVGPERVGLRLSLFGGFQVGIKGGGSRLGGRECTRGHR